MRAGGTTRGAARYLRRAVALEGAPERKVALARVRLKENAPAAALELLLPLPGTAPTALIEQAVDALGLASAQVEIDRVRLKAIADAARWTGP